MKQLSLFIVLILFINQLNQIESTHIKNFQDATPLKAVDIASEVVVQNTIKQITKNGLNKSDVDKDPNSYQILTADQSAESDPTQAGDEYYPGPNASVTVPTSVKNPSKRISRPSYRYYKKQRNAPYYGQPEEFRGLAYNNPNGAISVPVVYMDLDDFKATQDQLQALQTRLANAQVFVPQVNPEYRDNFNRTVYDKDPAPYYNTMSAHIKSGQDYLQNAIDKVESLLNVDMNPNPLNYTLTATDPAGFENPQNSINEKDNKIIGNNFWYPVNFSADDSVQVAASSNQTNSTNSTDTSSANATSASASSAAPATSNADAGASANSNSGVAASGASGSGSSPPSNAPVSAPATSRIQNSAEHEAHLNRIRELIKSENEKERKLVSEKEESEDEDEYEDEDEEKNLSKIEESDLHLDKTKLNRKFKDRRF